MKLKRIPLFFITMINKCPDRIPEPTRSEVVALVRDLDLVLVSKSRYNRGPTWRDKGFYVPVYRLKVDIKNQCVQVR